MPKVKRKPAAPVADDKFAGFPRDAMQFWHELAAEMNRDWFQANKQRYEDVWVTPMTKLLGEVRDKLAPAFKPVKLAEPKVLRIHRDVRFAKDKTPYKTHIGAVISLAGKRMQDGGTAAMYVHIGVEEEFVGVGTYFFDAQQLARWRKLVAGKEGANIAKLVQKLRAAGYEVGGHDDYKRVPKPYAEDHPRAELLKLKGLTGGFPEMPRGMLHEPRLVDWLVKHGKAMAPLVSWLHKHVR
jgi:uncharacterized protein (TIGR02453 family)